MKINLRNLVVLGLCFTFLCLSRQAEAAFDVSARPFEGGFDLRFGKAASAGPRINKEIIVSIASDLGKQYRLVQSLLEPLTNTQGVTIPQNNFSVYALRGTNRSGTLSIEQEVPVFLGRTNVYTSGTDGVSDSFTLVYGMHGPFNVPDGHYRGRIAYILEPVDATQPPVTVILNVFAEIQAGSSIEIKTASGLKTISLNSARQDKRAADVMVEIKGMLGSPFRILQLLSESLRSSEGSELPAGAINFMVSQVRSGSALAGTQAPLALREDALYASSPSGEPDSFLVTYSLADLTGAKAGRYRGRIKYFLEERSTAQTSLIDTCDLEVEISRLFDLTIKTETGSGSIEFRDLKAGQPPRTFEVLLQVDTNLGRQYQVSQSVLSDLINKDGQAIPGRYFTQVTLAENTKGALKITQKTEVRKGDTVLFVSDRDGSPDSFRVVYELVFPGDVPAGDYSTSVVYTLSEL